MSDPERRLSKAERKEQARLEREEIQRRTAASRRTKAIATIVGMVAVIAVIAIVVLTSSSDDTSAEPSGAAGLPGILLTPAPWPANTTDLESRLEELDLPAAGEVSHLHVPLYVVVEGAPTPVPADLGLTAQVHAPLHTHDTLGTVHVESADPSRTFTLGELFDVWGVRFSGDCLGGYCTEGDAAVRVYAGGEEVAGDPRSVVLEDQETIVVTYGTSDQVPDPLPEGSTTE